MEFFKYSKFWIEFLQTHLQLNIGIFIYSLTYSAGAFMSIKNEGIIPYIYRLVNILSHNIRVLCYYWDSRLNTGG